MGPLSDKFQAPIIALHKASWRVFEFTFGDEIEAELAANCVRCRISDRRECVNVFVISFGFDFLHQCHHGMRCDSFSLKGREDAPTDFVHEFIVPHFLPVANGTGCLCLLKRGDAKHASLITNL